MDRRRESRRSAHANVQIRVGGRTLQGLMRNLSRSGCMIESQALLVEIGAPVEVSLEPEVVVLGTVAWQLGECVGVSFEDPIAEPILDRFSDPANQRRSKDE